MKFTGFCLGVFLVWTFSASGQVTVEVTQDQQQFLPGEALKVAVRITNLSGQDLHLGGEEDWLSFAIESRDGTVVSKMGDAPIQGAFVLESSKVAIKRVDLAPYFVLALPGNYQIVATVHVSDWNRDITSPGRSFDLIEGSKLWEQDVGVPRTDGTTDSAPEMRRYILQQANYLKGRIRLYLRVTDTYGKPVRVLAVGPMVSFGRPEPQVDKLSNLHVLYQDGPFSFNYTVCNLQGDVIKRQTYDYNGGSRPRLRTDDDGNISVFGGVRHVAASDIPAPKQDDLSEVAPAVSANTNGAQATNQLSVVKPGR
jgi:hypothetical protein